MEYAPNDLTPRERYKVLTGFVLPRPIAWVTTVGPTGVVNAAPFSFFNVFCEDPPLCMFAANPRPDGRVKDTVVNIRRTGEFVVNSPMSRWRARCTIPAATFRLKSVNPVISA
jgi:flavin reductase (DIM6/NTAB) family NADH-FMN oxidoreductase RutF